MLEQKLTHTTTASMSGATVAPTFTQQEPWTLTVQEVAQNLRTHPSNGLTTAEAGERHLINGDNSLEDGKGISPWEIFLHQACNAMVLVLIIAMVISFAIRDYIAGGVITAVCAINIFVGFLQEFKAEQAMDSLRSLASPTAHVIRDASNRSVPSKHLVPGDVVELRAGDTVPADCRVTNAINLETDEALLTGESLPVRKEVDEIFPTLSPVGNRINMVFSSTTVSKGRGTAIVTAIGMNTEIGVIAKSLQGESQKFREVKRDEDGNARRRDYVKAFLGTVTDMAGAFLGTNQGTPLHRLLAKFSILLFVFAVILAIIAMAAQKFAVTREVAVYAIVVAIAMIPASLVVVLTITMAMGTQAMNARNVLVRKLDSLEALGAVNDICSDKTGTLTQGKMVLRKVWLPSSGEFDLSDTNEPYNPKVGTVSFQPEGSDSKTPLSGIPDDSVFKEWLDTAALVNIATVREVAEKDGSVNWKVTGDPTEIAIQVFVSRFGNGRDELTLGRKPSFSHVTEFPFDSSVKRMTSIYENTTSGDLVALTKGATERILGVCSTWYGMDDGEKRPFTSEDHKIVFENASRLAQQGLRVLSFARRELSDSPDAKWKGSSREDVEQNLTFLGLVGIYDPPRKETAGAVKMCHRAGINVHMVTGDHLETATAIAKQVGILPKDIHEFASDVVESMVITASDFDALTDDQIDALPVLPLVIARCAPQTKVRMIEALHRRGAFAAMTGDGVNDSPSLKKADVGIAMGIAGSDVAKDASDIILNDDNFASILSAVEEGRRMAENIQKFTLHLLAGNISQATFLMIGLAFKDSNNFSVFPLSPVEVLWIIMITSSFPAMGLGLQKADIDIMKKSPKDPKTAVFTWEVVLDMIVYGVIMAIICICSFVGIVYGEGHGQLGEGCNESYSESCRFVYRGRSTAFVQMTWCLLVLAWEVVDMRKSMFCYVPQGRPQSNLPLGGMAQVLWENKLLFWSVIIGFVTVFPVVYIPVINKSVFNHSPITWEWGVAFGGLIVFIAGSELYKWGKRVYYRHAKPEKELGDTTHLPFRKYHTSMSV